MKTYAHTYILKYDTETRTRSHVAANILPNVAQLGIEGIPCVIPGELSSLFLVLLVIRRHDSSNSLRLGHHPQPRGWARVKGESQEATLDHLGFVLSSHILKHDMLKYDIHIGVHHGIHIGIQYDIHTGGTVRHTHWGTVRHTHWGYSTTYTLEHDTRTGIRRTCHLMSPLLAPTLAVSETCVAVHFPSSPTTSRSLNIDSQVGVKQNRVWVRKEGVRERAERTSIHNLL